MAPPPDAAPRRHPESTDLRQNLRLAALLSAALAASPTLAGEATPRVHTESHHLPGDGGWDYVSFDPLHDRLFIGRNDGVQVVDARDFHLIATIGDPGGDHGAVVAADRNRVFTSDSKAHRLGVFSLDTLRKMSAVDLPGQPDGLLYLPAEGVVLAFMPDHKAIVAIDADSGAVRGEVPAGGEPEAGAIGDDGKVLVTLRDTAELITVDPRRLAVTARWPTGCIRPSPLAMDHATQRLFVGCRDRRLLLLDAANGRRVAELPISGLVDAAVFDPARKLIALASGEGGIDLVRETDAGHATALGRIDTAQGARTLALDVMAGRLFTVTADITSTEPPTPSRPYPLLHTTPGTFRVIAVQLSPQEP